MEQLWDYFYAPELLLKNIPLCAILYRCGSHIGFCEPGTEWKIIYQTQTYRNEVEVTENSLHFVI